MTEAVAPTSPECPLKEADPVVDEEESSTAGAVVTGGPTRPVPVRPVEAEVEWVAGVGETTAHQLAGATTKRPRVMGPVYGMVRTGRIITLPGQETAAKPAARAPSMKKFLKGGGSEAQKPGARAAAATSVTLTKKSTRSPTPRTVPRTSVPQETCPQRHLEFLRLGSSPPGECPQGGAGVEEVEVETHTGAAAAVEAQLGGTGSDLAQVPTLGLPSPWLQAGNSKVHLRPLDPKTWVEEEVQEKRRTRW